MPVSCATLLVGVLIASVCSVVVICVTVVVNVVCVTAPAILLSQRSDFYQTCAYIEN